MNSTTHSLCCCCETRTHTHRRVTEMRCVVDRDRSPSTSVRWWAFRFVVGCWCGAAVKNEKLPYLARSRSLSHSFTHPHTRERITALQKGGKGGVGRLRRVRKMPMHLPEVAHVCFDSVLMRGWSGEEESDRAGCVHGRNQNTTQLSVPTDSSRWTKLLLGFLFYFFRGILFRI